MDNLYHLPESFYSFIERNSSASPNALRLKYSAKKNTDFDFKFAIDQIECRQKCRSKLPSYINHKHFLFPSTLSAEQSTGEILANFHASLIQRDEIVLDMTCGLGIDSFAIANNASQVIACEINPLTALIAIHNAKVLGIDNLKVMNKNSVEFILQTTGTVFDTIFVDPARRGDSNKRTYAFSDCQPDILHLQEIFPKIAKRILIKASPMLDLSKVKQQLPNISRIWILSVRNDCKELLCECRFDDSLSKNSIIISSINFLVDGSIQRFDVNNTPDSSMCPVIDNIDTLTQGFIYEPNASILKSGHQDKLYGQYNSLIKLNNNTHLYWSESYWENFPGRKFQIQSMINRDDKKGTMIKGKHVNIICRNYPLSPEDVRKKLKTKDGGDNFLICAKATDKQIPVMLLTKRTV